jgi:penicillin G amidase
LLKLISMEDKPIPAWIKPFSLTGLLFLLLHFGNGSIGKLPAPGSFWNPFSGFWRNAETGPSKSQELRIPGLYEAVSVVYDKRGVPRIFAQNAHDLFLAQGYVVARDRLWQMEIQAMSSAGRLSEILGPSLLEHDRNQRRMAIPQGAERDLELIKQDVESWRAASAYADGVNAYIKTLSPGQYPVEYKLLGYAPQTWTPLNSALLIKNMQWMLSGGGDDLTLTNTLAKFGVEFVRKFYPAREPNIEPIIPAGTTWDFLEPKSLPTKLDSIPLIQPSPGQPFLPPLPNVPQAPTPVPVPVPALESRPNPGNGSNNFVISGTRSMNGSPLLANDPHLNLSLPSIWYEAQLSAPGISVYGVTLPGSPGVLIGFNQKIAWGLTNGQDDVYDWYKIQFRDSTLSEYKQADQWKPIQKDVQSIRIRGSATIFDTVLFTHHGPIVLKSQERPLNRNTPAMHALKWLALEPSNELHAILQIMKASDYQQFSSALKNFHCPSQNFAFASVNGDIGMFHHGLFPRKWTGQGRFVMDGSESGNDWSGWVPQTELPEAKNPEQGWLFSANNKPTDTTYPHYLGNHFINGERAQRLSQLLAEADSLTPAQAFNILLDDYDLHAAEILPSLLNILTQNRGSKNQLNVFSPSDSAIIALLGKWDFRHHSDQIAASLFDSWWKQLYRGIWQDEFGDDDLRYQWPSQERTRQLIQEEPDSDWYNDITTTLKETLYFLVIRSFREACAHVQGKTWSQYRPVQIRHLAQIDAFSQLQVATGGCATCINAMKESHGPAWRMVVTLDQQPHGIGIYPGGQSGNPGSRHYDDFIADWAAGRAYDLKFMPNPGDPSAVYSLQLLGK